MKKVFIVTGELSGDHLAGWYVNRLKKQKQSFQVDAVGGDSLQVAGAHIHQRFETLNVTGLIEIIRHLPRILGSLKNLSKHILAGDYDEVVLVDFPGFNLRLAKKLKVKNPSLKITYLSPPQLWCWGAWRIKSLKQYCDKLIVLYPFEVDWYKQRAVEAQWLGSPVYERLDLLISPSIQPTPRLRRTGNPLILSESPSDSYRRIGASASYPASSSAAEGSVSRSQKQKQIAILPGSRQSEIEALLPTFLKIAQYVKKKHPELKFILPVAQSISQSKLKSVARGAGLDDVWTSVEILSGDKQKYKKLAECCLAISKPGTVTLELALLGVPTVVMYKASWITYFIARMVVNVKYMSLPNLLLNKEVFKEFIQYDCDSVTIGNYVSSLYQDFLGQGDSYKYMLDDCDDVRKLLSSR